MRLLTTAVQKALSCIGLSDDSVRNGERVFVMLKCDPYAYAYRDQLENDFSALIEGANLYVMGLADMSELLSVTKASISLLDRIAGHYASKGLNDQSARVDALARSMSRSLAWV